MSEKWPRAKSGLVSVDMLAEEIRKALGDDWTPEDADLIEKLITYVFRRWMKMPNGDSPKEFKRVYDENKTRALGAVVAIVEVMRDLGDCKPNDILDALNREVQ